MMAASADPADRERFAALMIRDVDRLDRLVSGVRVLARIDGQLESEPLETVDLLQLTEEVIAGLRLSAPAAHAIALRHVGSRQALVRGARERLVQVIENLLTNAPIGLGLAIARTIITGYGGTIRAANREAGGAVFEIQLRGTTLPFRDA